MTSTRFLPGVVLLAVAAGPVAAQPVMPPYSPPGRTAGVIPSVAPAGAQDPPVAPQPSTSPANPDPLPTPAAVADRLGALTGQPIPAGPGTGPLPPGAYASPWRMTDAPGCCGPLGLNGPVHYEVYARTGVNLVFGNGPFTDRLNPGWVIAGGGRSLFFNTGMDAAWAIDLGLSYQHNRGELRDPTNLFIRQNPTQNPVTGQRQDQPDLLLLTRIRALHRTAFNFALGREWFVWGPGVPGCEAGWNLRYGVDVGGRWGTMHVDLRPLADDGSAEFYARRQNVFHGLFLGAHATVEVPMGGWIWFGGLRTQYVYDWSNVVPPLNGDVQNVDLLLTAGVRF
jgi:hypothetical protein